MKYRYMIVAALLLLAVSATVSAEICIRVIVPASKDQKLPGPDEQLTRVGTSNGETLLGGVRYSGVIEVWKGEKGLYIINELPIEEYIKGVVAAEVGKSWDKEALKAQAVVARTYALHQLGMARKNLPYHLSATVLHQVYKGSSGSPAIEEAVSGTEREILTYEGKPIIAFYHSTSGGMTEDSSEVFGKAYPYLKAVPTNSELSPYFMWERSIPVNEIEKALDIQGIKDVTIDSCTPSTRVKYLRVALESGDRAVSAHELRKAIGWDRLPSTMITAITRRNGSIVFEGKGFGHGVGMCQWSALQMAKEGKTYREILYYFYPNTVIEKYADR